MNIVWPEDTTETIDAIRGAIGRNVTFVVTVSSISCHVCELDPVTSTSMNQFCVYCSGLYYTPVYSGYVISGHVTWAGADIMGWVAGGQYFDGDCRVQIKHTATNLNIVDNTEYVEIDNKVLTIKSKILRGVQNLNRIILDLIEKE